MQSPFTDRFFNTAGPVRADWHYLINPLERWDMDSILRLIAQGKYFVLHAPRQTGKTSCLLALMEYLNAQGRYQTLYVNVESAQALRNDVQKSIPNICHSIARAAKIYLEDHQLADLNRQVLTENDVPGALGELLTRWAMQAERPVVLIIDEIDSLVGDTLISVLRQLRAGYLQRPGAFPLPVILCGVRDVRDYRIHTSDSEIITAGSAFNIKAESLRLGNFVSDEVEKLLLQHTELTGQRFEPSAVDYLWEQTQGQP